MTEKGSGKSRRGLLRLFTGDSRDDTPESDIHTGSEDPLSREASSSDDPPIAEASDQEEGADAGVDSEDLAEELGNNPDKATIESVAARHGLPVALVAAIAFGALATPEAAHAFSVNSVIKRATKEMTKQIQPILQNIMSAFGVDLFKIMGQASDKTTTAVGMAGDRIAQAAYDIDERDMENAARPDAASCVSDAGGMGVVGLGRNSARRQILVNQASINEMMGNPRSTPKLMAEARQRRSEFGSTNKDLNAATFSAPSGYSEGERKAAWAFRKRSSLSNMAASRKLSERASNSAGGKVYELAQTEFVSKTSVVDSVYASILSNRSRDKSSRQAIEAALNEEKDPTQYSKDLLRELDPNNEGLSYVDVLRFEAERRYGNPEWHATLRQGMIHPAALLRELNSQQAFNNYIAVQNYLQNDKQLMLLATQLSELLTQRSGDLQDSFRVNASSVPVDSE